MTNEEFQNVILSELKGLKAEVGGLKAEVRGLKAEVGELKERVGSIEERQKSMEIRQDEIYQVVRSIEHSNQVGRSELDSQNIRLAKVEGKIKKAAKVFNEEIDVEEASNL